MYSLEHLIEKFVDGNINAQELQELESFIDSKVHGIEFFEKYIIDNQSERKDAIYKAVIKKINLVHRKKRRRLMFRRSSILGLFLLVIVMVWQYNDITTQPFVTQITNAADSLYFEDGSFAYLGKNSEVSYPKQFSAEQRELTLMRGSAFFEVAKVENRPFTIHIGTMDVEVLGTSFHLDFENDVSTVTVVTGIVELKLPNRDIILKSGQQIVFDQLSNTIEEHQLTNALVYKQLIQGDLSLTNISMEEVAYLISLKYGRQVYFDQEKIKHRSMRIHIAKEDDLISVLEQLKYINEIDYSLDEKNIHLYE